jgi:hypothetical protein
MNRRWTSIGAGALGVVAIAGCTDSHDVRFYSFERCIIRGGGTVGDDAYLIWDDEGVESVVGDVQASPELLKSCLNPPVVSPF